MNDRDKSKSTVHQLTPADLALMDALLDTFSEAFEDSANYASKRPSPAYMRQWLQSTSSIALVALQAGRVVAGLVAYELQKFEQERSEIYIYDLAVAASHRRQGIASALIAHVQHIAAERGAWVIFVQADTDEDDQAAIALYSKLGQREEVLHFDIAVPGTRLPC
jgi:aminoglycoside 3-N-acetyltransferase I